MERDELAAWLRLAMTPQIGPVTARQLLRSFGLPQAIFSLPAEDLATVLTRAQLQSLRTPPPGWPEQVEVTRRWLDEGGGTRRLITLADADYPPGLLQIDDPPHLLHAWGVPLARQRPLAWPPSLAIVGSRSPTAQGLANARQFARHLAGAGWTVVSGLALGIDGAAHAGALEGARPGAIATIAVVGTGLDRSYPRQHEALARQVAERGVVLSEYLLGTPPLPDNFPRRNRIIAGLARGTLVVEAALRSGSLITARMAAEQGREVFAIPGSIHAPQSRGCHALIRQGAKLVETAQDVLDEVGGTPTAGDPSTEPGSGGDDAAGRERAAPETLDPVLEACGYDPVDLDTLAARTGLPIAILQARLLDLELEGKLARLPGGRFQRQARA